MFERILSRENVDLLARWALLVVVCVVGVGCQSRPVDPDAFVVLLDSSPKGLDPRFANSDASGKLVGLLHAGLVSVDTPSGKPKLDLAESIDQVSAVRYDITLRDDASFHDGQPVTAADVKYTLTTLDDDPVNSPFAATARRIKSFEIHDSRHMTLVLDKPYAPFLNSLSLGIVPAHICRGHSSCPGKPIGAGPFEYVRQEADQLYVFRSNPDYFGGKPPIDDLVFKVVEDDNTRLLALLGKSADLVQNAVAPLMLPVVEDVDRLKVRSAPSCKYTYIGFNLEHPIIKHRKVRQAIAHGIDRRAIIKYKFKGHAQLSTGMLRPSHWAYEPQVATYDYDVSEAKKLLDAAGYPDPDGDGPRPRFELEFKVSANKFRKSLADLIAHQLERIGIKLTVRSYEWGTFFHDIKSRNFSMTTLQWTSVGDPSIYTWIFHSKNIPSPDNRAAGANRGGYRNERVDELLERGERETDRDKRRAIYREVQAILARDLPYISLWHEQNIAIMADDVTGYFMTPNASFRGLIEARRRPELAGAAKPTDSGR